MSVSHLLRRELASRENYITLDESAKAMAVELDAKDARLLLAAHSEFVFVTKGDHDGHTPKYLVDLPNAMTILRRKADGSKSFTDLERARVAYDYATHVALSLTPDLYRLPIYRPRNDPKHGEFIATLRQYKRAGDRFLLAEIVFNQKGWLQDTNNQFLFADCVRLRYTVSDATLQKLFNASRDWKLDAVSEYVRHFRPLPRRPGGRIGRAICQGPTKRELRDHVAKIERLKIQYFRRFTK